MSEPEQNQPPTTKEIVKQMVACRDERRKIAARDKELIAIWKSLELEMLVRLDDQGMEQAKTADGTASVIETVLPNVVDWDELQIHDRERLVVPSTETPGSSRLP